jgi:hypothetical protein
VSGKSRVEIIVEKFEIYVKMKIQNLSWNEPHWRDGGKSEKARQLV